MTYVYLANDNTKATQIHKKKSRETPLEHLLGNNRFSFGRTVSLRTARLRNDDDDDDEVHTYFKARPRGPRNLTCASTAKRGPHITIRVCKQFEHTQRAATKTIEKGQIIRGSSRRWMLMKSL